MSAAVPPAGPAPAPLCFPSRDTPLASVRIAAFGGSAADPVGKEGLARQLVELGRRGAGELPRAVLDEELDRIGAELDAGSGRDAVTLRGTCLSRNLDRLIDLAAAVLARPRLEVEEHEKLLRETRHVLDDLRDDDEELAYRFFHRYVAPGHPYSRSAYGTADSLARLSLDEVERGYRRQIAWGNLVVGFAGDLDRDRAGSLAARLTGDLPSAGPLVPEVGPVAAPRGRRLYLVDKPERTQSQIVFGHPVPAQGTPDFLALLPVETAFGGTMSSRLVQEIRVARGWSYGVGCRLARGRGPMWISVHLAPAAEQTAAALARTLELYEELAAEGITEKEFRFAVAYLTGSLPFQVATARQRLGVAVHSVTCGLPPDYTAELGRRLAALSPAESLEAAARWLRPRDLAIVVVATADQVLRELERLGFDAVEVVPFDSY